MTEPSRDLEMQIAARDGMIVLLFSRRKDNGDAEKAHTDHFAFPANLASQMAQTICDLAFEIDTSLKPVGTALKADLVQRHKDKLMPRINVVLGTLREDKTLSNGQLALKLIDIIFSEIFS